MRLSEAVRREAEKALRLVVEEPLQNHEAYFVDCIISAVLSEINDQLSQTMLREDQPSDLSIPRGNNEKPNR